MSPREVPLTSFSQSVVIGRLRALTDEDQDFLGQKIIKFDDDVGPLTVSLVRELMDH